MSFTVDPEYLRQLRQAKKNSGMSASVIAARAGFTGQTVANLTSGASLGRRENVVALLDAIMPSGSPEWQRILDLYDQQVEAREQQRMAQLVGIDTLRSRARDDGRQAIADAINNLADAVRELAKR